MLYVTLAQNRGNGPPGNGISDPVVQLTRSLNCRFVVRIIRITSRTSKNPQAFSSFLGRISELGFPEVGVSVSFFKITPPLSLICVEGEEALLYPLGMTPSVIGWLPTVCRAKEPVANLPRQERR